MSDDQSCQPSGPNRTLLTIGQDLFSIQEYVTSQYNASLHQNRTNNNHVRDFFPSATMFYTDIQSLRGMDTPIDYGSGVEYAEALAEAYPDSGIQVGLWLNGTAGCRDIVNGNLENNVKHMFQSIARWKVPKVFLRVGYGKSFFGTRFMIPPRFHTLLGHFNVQITTRRQSLTIPILDIRKIHPRTKKPFGYSSGSAGHNLGGITATR
jgi:hypothetical protein